MQRPLPRIFLALALAALILAACRPVREPQISGPAATPTRVVAPVVPPDAAGDWGRIQAAGRIVVGTSANFPPFEYYDGSFQFAGYDVALLQALGRRLGLEVVFKDFALEGLSDALALGQIDVAAAALTVTPERAAAADFTQPYFATSEGLLAQPGAAAGSIAALEELAGLRIGVERGSVHESWLRRSLVDTGLSAEQDLILYTTVDTAAPDLAAGRIDLLVTDLPAAQQLARQYNLPLAGGGLLAEQYALAVRSGADELRGQLDAALAALAADGTLAQLARRHLGSEPMQLLPSGELPAPDAAASAAAEQICINGLAWLEDLSLLDQGMTTPAVMAPGQPFTKSWRVLNTGTCTWDAGYQLVFAHGSAPGASMGGQPAFVAGEVLPGNTAVLTATLVAPITSGVFEGSWQMQDAEGRAFGERLRVGVQVAGVPTPTPAPTQTPAAGVTFTADAERVLQGSPVTLRWNVTDADEVYFFEAGQSDWMGHPVAAQGEETVIPRATTTYQLRIVRGGEAEDRLLAVYVEPNPDLPQVKQFALSPGGELPSGQCVTITWQVDGEVDQTVIFRNKEALWEDAPLAGALEDCPESVGEYEYAVGAQGPGGRNYAVAVLRVVAAAAVAPAAAAGAPAGPGIDRFSVLPESLTVGGCVELRWSVSGEAANIQILRGADILLDGAPAAGSGSDCPTEQGSHRYRLVATDAAGRSSEGSALVTVSAPTPAATPAPAAAAPFAAAPNATPGATPSAPPLPGQEMPAGHEFLLVSYRNAAGELTSPLTGTQVTMTLGQDGAISGSGGCNTYSSSYQLSAAAEGATAPSGALTIAPVAATEKFCAEPIGLMDQEAQYLTVLPAAATYELEAGEFTLFDGAGNPVAIYVMVR